MTYLWRIEFSTQYSWIQGSAVGSNDSWPWFTPYETPSPSLVLKTPEQFRSLHHPPLPPLHTSFNTDHAFTRVFVLTDRPQFSSFQNSPARKQFDCNSSPWEYDRVSYPVRNTTAWVTPSCDRADFYSTRKMAGRGSRFCNLFLFIIIYLLLFFYFYF